MAFVVKIWNCTRSRKETLIVKPGEDFERKVKLKFGASEDDDLRLAMEDDGTNVEIDPELLGLIGGSTTYIALFGGEQWTSPNLAHTGSTTPVQLVRSPHPSASTDEMSLVIPTESNNPVNKSASSSSVQSPVSPFISQESLKLFLSEHPLTKMHSASLTESHVSVDARQAATRVVASKMIDIYGDYPSAKQKEWVASLLGNLFKMPTGVFYDKVSYNGFLQRSIENVRRKWETSRKAFTWNKTSTPNSTIRSKETKRLKLSIGDETASSSAEPNGNGCCRGQPECQIREGRPITIDDEISKMKALTTTRTDELLLCAARTYCHRQNWVLTASPSLTDIIVKYPKFCTVPQLIDQEFRLKFPDVTCDFLLEFPVAALLAYGINSTNGEIHRAALDANDASDDWKPYFAAKIACLLMRMTNKKKHISSIEAFENLFHFVPLGTSVNEVGERRTDSDPILLIQGEFMKSVHTVKVAVDLSVIEAGSSVLEGMDRLFKILWIFNLSYNDRSATFLIFVQTLFGIKYGSVPTTVKQLRSFVCKN